jgi:hypothetical protein
MKKTKIVATFVVYPQSTSETNARLLIESIRTFGGALSDITLWCLAPKIKMDLSQAFRDLLYANNVRLMLFEADRTAARFPLAADVVAAAHAEANARNSYDLLIWFGANTVVFHEPGQLLIPDNTQIGYRPVHHINIGAPFDQPMNPFWSSVYQACQVPMDRMFSMKTHVDGKKILPYFNATALVIRPDRGLLTRWCDTFLKLYQKPEFCVFYKQNEQYAVFMHQAILSGVILAMFQRNDLLQLPPTYNYPLHLLDQDITDFRPHALNDLVTVRHEGFYKDPDWREKMPEGEDLKNWLEQRIDPARKNRRS